MTGPTPTERIPVIDTDVHAATVGATVGRDSSESAPRGWMAHLPSRWQDWIDTYGARYMWLSGERPRQRPGAVRMDAWGPDGAVPGSDPDFIRRQHLDQHDLSAAVINDLSGLRCTGLRPYPEDFCLAWARAHNQDRLETWFASDPRWYGSITTAYEVPGAEKEIVRCMEESGEFKDRWVQVLFAPDNERPVGHKKYWPIFEACEHYGLVAGFHVGTTRATTGTGTPNFYFEEHALIATWNFPLVASLIFEGVFERFPNLKIGLIELGWSWVVPYAWRLDKAFDMMRGEVRHLTKKPSEYIAEHFSFSTQPIEEPERLEWFDDVFDLHRQVMGNKLMYSSDYPHWDFDPPEVIPQTLPLDERRRVLGTNAAELYGIKLRENSGLEIELATR